jgi:hypothetical protein
MLTSGPHLSDTVRRAGPAWQHAVAAWLPCAALLTRLKGVVETARRASRQPSRPSLAPPARQPCPSRHRPPHASPLALSPDSAHPDLRGLKPPNPGPSLCRLTARLSPLCRTAVPAPVSRSFPRPSPVHRWGATVGPLCNTAAVQLRRAVRRTLRGPPELGRARCAGRSQAGPSPRGRGTQIRFYIF